MVVWLKNIERLCAMLGREFDYKSYILLDVGCGSGISTIFFSCKYPFKKFIGLDFSVSLISLANQNKELFVGVERSGQVSFQVSDARVIELASEPYVLFLFNPFGRDTLKRFLENNINHLRNSNSFLLYANDIHLSELLCYGDLLCRDDFYNLSVVGFSER